MEAFSLLRYWRTTNAGSNTTTNADVTTTIVTTQSSETDDDNDHGPFFDLEFSLPEEEEDDDDDVKQAAAENKILKNAEAENSVDDCDEDVDGSDESGDEDESELKFTLVDSDSSGESTPDVNVSVSPSDELFFNGGFVPVEQQAAEIRSKPFQSQPRVLLMKSATKFRVMMLKLKKIKSNETADSNASNCSSSKEDASIVSLFKRHNSSKAPKKRQNDVVEPASVSSEEKKFSKEAMQKYLRKVKPLYVRVSNRYGEKLKFTGQLKKTKSEATEPSPATEKESKSEVNEPPLLPNNVKALKQGNLPAGLGVVCKHLRKSRSAFTAVAAAPAGAVSSNRRDDSLIQQQDGIQSAILHCKRSFKASRDSDCSSSSGSDPVPLLLGKSEHSCDAAEETAEINKR